MISEAGPAGEIAPVGQTRTSEKVNGRVVHIHAGGRECSHHANGTGDPELDKLAAFRAQEVRKRELEEELRRAEEDERLRQEEEIRREAERRVALKAAEEAKLFQEFLAMKRAMSEQQQKAATAASSSESVPQTQSVGKG